MFEGFCAESGQWSPSELFDGSSDKMFPQYTGQELLKEVDDQGKPTFRTSFLKFRCS